MADLISEASPAICPFNTLTRNRGKTNQLVGTATPSNIFIQMSYKSCDENILFSLTYASFAKGSLFNDEASHF
nr:hypothetical protein HAGR004_40550 [Bdellovibrio sp. HAGR004]